jgi:hypothetical protein
MKVLHSRNLPVLGALLLAASIGCGGGETKKIVEPTQSYPLPNPQLQSADVSGKATIPSGPSATK